MLNITPLKVWAKNNLDRNHPFRTVVLAENDLMENHEFVVMAPRLVNLIEDKCVNEVK